MEAWEKYLVALPDPEHFVIFSSALSNQEVFLTDYEPQIESTETTL